MRKLLLMVLLLLAGSKAQALTVAEIACMDREIAAMRAGIDDATEGAILRARALLANIELRCPSVTGIFFQIWISGDLSPDFLRRGIGWRYNTALGFRDQGAIFVLDPVLSRQIVSEAAWIRSCKPAPGYDIQVSRAGAREMPTARPAP